MGASIQILAAPLTPADAQALQTLLRDAVESGASVGFMLPLTADEVRHYWSDVEADIASRTRCLLVARENDCIVGSVQLALATKPNSRHRAEVQKLLVLRSARAHGIGTALMQAVEPAALAVGRTLLVLDTSASGNALNLYHRCGYQRVGLIPRYARDPDGPMIDTIVYYKELTRT